MTFNDWEEAHRDEIGGLWAFALKILPDDPVGLSGALRESVGHFGRAGQLANTAGGFLKIALVEKYPDRGPVEYRKMVAKKEAAREEKCYLDLKHLCDTIEKMMDIGRTQASTDRAQYRAGGLTT